MKRLIPGLALGLLLTFGATAQDQGGNKNSQPTPPGNVIAPARPATGITPQALTVSLGLNADQRARVERMYQDWQDRNNQIKADGGLTQDQRLQRMMKSRDEYITQVRGQLTDEQKVKFEEVLKTDTSGAAQEFTLNAEQRQKILEITKRYNKIKAEKMEDPKLNPQDRQKAIREVEKQMLDEIKGVFTPEQRARFEERQKNLDEAKAKESKPAEKKPESKEGDKKGDK